MTKAILVLIVCLCIITGAAFAAEKPTASGMETPITLAVKGEALSDVIQSLKAQSGVILTVAKDIADLKVTIFVDKQPLSRVMAGLKTLFHFEWYRKEYTGKMIYEFSRSLKIRNETSDGYDVDAIWQQLDKKLAAMDDKTQPSAANADETSKTAAAMIRSFPPELKNALIQGYTICLDSGSSEPQWQVPHSLSGPLMKPPGVEIIKPNSDDSQPLQSRVQAGISSKIEHEGNTAKMQITAKVQVKQTYKNSESQFTSNRNLFPGGIELDAMPLPPDYLPHDNAASLSDTHIALSTSDISIESGLPNQLNTSDGVPANRSDLLALIHQKTGTQIIADHHSAWSMWSNVPDMSSANLIQMLAKKNQESYWGSDGLFVYMRTIDTQKWDAEEMPDKILQPIREFSDANGYLDLDQLASIVISGKRKATALQHNAPYLGLPAYLEQSGFQNEPIRQALTLYGNLTAYQHKGILKGGLDLSSLTPKQRAAVAACLNTGTGINNRMNRVIVGIYENDVRIDRPEPPSPDDPIGIKIVPGVVQVGGGMMGGTPMQNGSLTVIPERKDSEVNTMTQKATTVSGYTLELIFANKPMQTIAIPIEGKAP